MEEYTSGVPQTPPSEGSAPAPQMPPPPPPPPPAGYYYGNPPFYGNGYAGNFTYVNGFGFIPETPQQKERKTIRRSATAAGAAMIFYLVVSFAISPLLLVVDQIVSQLLPFAIAEVISQLLDCIVYLLSIALPFAIYWAITRVPARIAFPMRLPKGGMTTASVFAALGTSVIGIVSASTLMAVFESIGLSYYLPDIPAPTGMAAKIIYLLELSLLPALLEEFAFRGVLMQSLRRFGDSFAVITSAIVFALFHGNFVQIPNTFLLGMMIGFLVIRSGSLWTGIIIHFVNNFVVTFLDLFVFSGLSQNMQNLLYNLLLLVYAIAGVIAFFCLSRKYTGFFSLKPANTVLAEKAKLGAFFSAATVIIGMILLGLLSLSYFLL